MVSTQRVGLQMLGQPGVISRQQVNPPGLDIGQPGFADVVADDAGIVVSQGQRRGQAHVAQADDGDGVAQQGRRRGGDRDGRQLPLQLDVMSVWAPTTVQAGGVPSTA